MTVERQSSDLLRPGRIVQRWRRTALYIVLGLVFASLLLLGLRPSPAPVEVASVVQGPMEVTLREEGKTRPVRRYLISAPVAGNVQRIELRAGDAVQAGETVLAVLDPLPAALLDARARAMAEARREAARADLERARAALNWATRERERVERLHAAGSATPQELDAAVWRHVDALHQVTVAENRLRIVEAELEPFVHASDSKSAGRPILLRAPIDGRVLRVYEENERVVAAGTPLMEVGNPEELEVVIEVLSQEAVGLQPGQPVRLEQWGGRMPLEGRIRRIEPSAFTKVSALGVEEQRVRVIADVVTPAQDRAGLGDQFRVEAVIVRWQAPAVRKVPLGALFRRGSDWAVFVLKAGRAQFRRIEVGHLNEREAEVLSGLQEGEKVILYPGERVRDGQRVQPVQIAS
ncbi:MAG: efflux RND transporter periplasmic adaptor subunit [Verrucomicrobiota bacterium]|nr:efflux RND transporter periplasmic adaptor subunit [Limisphaera sp.]MDW8382056.1 efflux RND transporter periplasmic adaptor subunit [Verrucomicrobiota bacterium]